MKNNVKIEPARYVNTLFKYENHVSFGLPKYQKLISPLAFFGIYIKLYKY